MKLKKEEIFIDEDLQKARYPWVLKLSGSGLKLPLKRRVRNEVFPCY